MVVESLHEPQYHATALLPRLARTCGVRSRRAIRRSDGLTDHCAHCYAQRHTTADADRNIASDTRTHQHTHSEPDRYTHTRAQSNTNTPAPPDGQEPSGGCLSGQRGRH